jgi:uncharacterized protein HemY
MPDPIQYIARFLIVAGVIIAFIGVLLLLLKNTGIPFGRLPGDIIIQKKNFTFYFPVATSILMSIILTLILYLLFRR